jgi:16S rRNA (uracil1498-N3)-methyltransferase
VIRVRVAAAQLRSGALRLSGPEHHYLMRVRRVRVGEAVELFDGSGGAAYSIIAAIDGESTVLHVGQVHSGATPGLHLTAIVPLLKGDRMDQCIEKLIEVGCDHLILWAASRSVVRLDGARQQARLERIRAQVTAAVRQSGRSAIPPVEGVWSLAEVQERCADSRRIALVPEAAPMRPHQATAQGCQAAAVLSGPEGGLAATEMEGLVAAGFELASLTDTVLRAETAPVVAIAIWRWAERSALPTSSE